MQKSKRALITAVSGILVLGGGARAQERGGGETSPEAQQVAATLEAVFAATEGGDFAALDTLYAGDELTIVEGAGLDRGWSRSRDHHLKPELEEFDELVYRPMGIETYLAGDWAWALFEYDLRVSMEGRDEIDRIGRGTAVFEKREGRWIVRHMQTASRAR